MYCQLFLFQSYVILLFRIPIANVMSTLEESFNRIYRMCVKYVCTLVMLLTQGVLSHTLMNKNLPDLCTDG